MSYSWGDDTSISNTSGGYDYGSARAGYASPSSSRTNVSSRATGSSRIGGTPIPSSSSNRRAYGATNSNNIPVAFGRRLQTNSPYPLVIAVDVTGSMSDWPRIIFEKLPLLYDEAQRYLPGVEISFAAIGDAYTDRYPIQTCDFAQGKTLDGILNTIYPESGGGGQEKESYEMTGFFYSNYCDIPNAKKPIMIFTGDEGFYSKLLRNQINESIDKSVSEDVDAKKIFADLTRKFDTYILRKEYGGGSESRIINQWESVLGKERVLKLDDPRRVVDCIIGIVAGAVDEFDNYTARLSQRQTTGQVTQVLKALTPLTGNKGLIEGESVKKITQNSDGNKSKRLI